jgi:hypothetical protein
MSREQRSPTKERKKNMFEKSYAILTKENSAIAYQGMIRYINKHGSVENGWSPLGLNMTDSDWADIEKRITEELIDYVACDWGLYAIVIKKHFQ